MELFAGKKIVDALVEGMMLGDEVLSLPAHPLARGGIAEVIGAAVETLLEILVPCAVITFAEK